MKLAAIQSEIEKFDLLSPVYEKSLTDAYPMVLHSNESNNKLYGKHQYLLSDMTRYAKKLLNQPIQYEGDQLVLFGVQLIGTKETTQSYIDKIVHYESKIEMLRQNKVKEYLLGEIELATHKLINKALIDYVSDSDQLDTDLTKLLGVSTILKHDLSDFLSLRYKSRNYLLKSLRYIISDDAEDEAVLPELTQLKHSVQYDSKAFNSSIRDYLLTHYGLVGGDQEYPNLIGELKYLVREKGAEASRVDLPVFLNVLQKTEGCLQFLEDLLRRDQETGRYVLESLSRTDNRPKQFKAYLDNAVAILNDHKDRFDLFSRLHTFNSTSQLDNRNSLYCSREEYEKLQAINPNFIDLVNAYLISSKFEGYSFSNLPVIFLEKFVLSPYYEYSNHSNEVIKLLLTSKEAKPYFRDKFSNGADIFSSSRHGIIRNQDFQFYAHLVSLLIGAKGNPIECLKTIEASKLLKEMIPDQNRTYRDAIYEYRDIESYIELLNNHNSWVALLENLSESNALQAKISKQLRDEEHGFDLIALNAKDQLKAVFRNQEIVHHFSKEIVSSIYNDKMILCPFIKERPYLAVISVTYVGFMKPPVFSLYKVMGEDVGDSQKLEALKITDYLNQRNEKSPN